MRKESIRNGTFTSGKFSGQPLYAPYFWQQVKQGLADDRQGNTYIFDITPKDIEKFPELGRYEIVKIHEDGKGFISAEADYE